MLTVFPDKEGVWIRAAQLERQHGTPETVDALMTRGVQYCPQAEILWLMAAKDRWMAGDVEGARDVLKAAWGANPDSEEIYLAAVKVESENKEYDRARSLLGRARDRASTPRVWMKSAKLERLLHEDEAELKLLEEGVHLYPQYSRLWIMLAQHHTRKGNHVAARKVYKDAVRACPTAVNLWICSANFEAGQTHYSKARAILEAARLKNPGNDRLFLTGVRIERQARNIAAAQQLLAKGFQECPTSGILWAHAIATDPRPARRTRSFDALSRCERDPYVCTAVARLFWLDRKLRKARDWFNRAVLFDPDFGDAWAYFYKFEQSLGKKSNVVALEKRVEEAEPRHGEVWQRISKDDAFVGLKNIPILQKVAELIDPQNVFSLD
jgi:pre-mRNA-processing factor 6